MAVDKDNFRLDPDRPGWADHLSDERSRAERLLTVCAWCERVKVEDDWVGAEVAIRTLRTFDWPEAPLFTHGMCEHCFAFLTASRPPTDTGPSLEAA
jgi:hypothetical protein